MCVSLARAKEHAMIHHAITNEEHVFSLARAKEHAMSRYGNKMLHSIIVLLWALDLNPKISPATIDLVTKTVVVYLKSTSAGSNKRTCE